MFEPHLNARRLTLLDRPEQDVVFLTWVELDRELCGARGIAHQLEVVDLQIEVRIESHPLLGVLEVEA